MRVLITGADGFAGQHLIREIRSNDADAQLHGTSFRPFQSPDADVTYHSLDLRDEQAVANLIESVQPDQVYHLAALANVGQSYSAVWSTLENNIRAQLNLILACLKLDLRPNMLIVSSGEIYGGYPSEKPTPETAPFCPTNPYSVSKITQDMLALQYHLSDDLPILRARPFNHLGPGQNPGFVAPDFAQQIARIEVGQQEPVIRVGDLSTERDFTDVRDVVRAYRLIMTHGTPGEAYNIASGRTCTIRALLDGLLAYTSANIEIQRDLSRRPSGVPRTWGDASYLRAATGWQPTIPLEQSLRDVLEDYRQRVHALNEEAK